MNRYEGKTAVIELLTLVMGMDMDMVRELIQGYEREELEAVLCASLSLSTALMIMPEVMGHGPEQFLKGLALKVAKRQTESGENP